MRNSSLVKQFCAEDLPGLKHSTEAMGFEINLGSVGERSKGGEGRPQGRLDRLEVSMPESVTKRQVKNLSAESLRFPGQC